MSTYRRPTAAQVQAALLRLSRSQVRRAFFEGIENPLWVKPLAEAGAFSHPPEPVIAEDGYPRERYWPEAIYLGRVATQAPTDVVDVLLSLSESESSWYRRAVVEVAAKIPAQEAVRLMPLISSWVGSGFGWRTDPEHLVGAACNLIDGGQREEGIRLADLIFRPEPDPTNDQKAKLLLDEHWYPAGLKRMATRLKPDGLPVALRWLLAYERAVRRLGDDFDYTYFSRESVGVQGEWHDRVEQALIDVVSDLATEAMCIDPVHGRDCLLGSHALIARKIALFSMAEAMQDCSNSDAANLTQVALTLLFDTESIVHSCRIEYAELARSVAAVIPEALEPLTELLDPGLRDDADRRIAWLRSSSDQDEAGTEQLIRDEQDRWRHLWLASIGADALPPRARTLLADLDARFGPIDAPLTPTQMIAVSYGPTSALTQVEMAAMSPTELVAHLESWHQLDDFGPRASHEGQGRELSALLASNPRAIGDTDSLITRLRPVYIRAILQGWAAAHKSGLDLDWDCVLGLLTDVLNHADESTFSAEGGKWDDDRDYRDAKRSAVSLIDELTMKRTDRSTPDEVIAELAPALLSAANDDAAWREYVDESQDTEMDALTLSLNWRWPRSVRGLTHLIAHGPAKPWSDVARAALDAAMERDDPRGSSSAVIGEALGRLFDADRAWTAERVPRWFGTVATLTERQQIALTTAIFVHRYHHGLFDLLQPALFAAVWSTEPLTAGWRADRPPLQQVGEWIISAVIRGDKPSDEPIVASFFDLAPPKIRGGAIGGIAWSFMRSSVVDDAIRDRFAELWDRRVEHVEAHPEDSEELAGFHWFVQSGKFAAEWWLPRLNRALDLYPDLGRERYMIGKQLALASEADPKSALSVLQRLLAERDEAGVPSFDLARRAVPMVIARAIASGDEELRIQAESYMHSLGEQGNLSLYDEVQSFLNGTATAADIADL